MAGGAMRGPNGRAVIVGGLRTPFVKSGTSFREVSALRLAQLSVSEMLWRLNLAPESVERVVFGQVVPDTRAPNVAREIVLGTGMKRQTDAYSVSRACATSTQAIVDAAQSILLGDCEVVIAGGTESLSRPPITVSDGLTDALMRANSAKDPLQKAKPFLDLKPRDLVPRAPAIAELSTGETMGESAEKMAKENSISRADQDAFALRSHQRAEAAWREGRYDDEVMKLNVPERFDLTVERDGLVRGDSTLEKLASLRPAFDKHYGSVTAGNASPLTDGASAVVLMSEEKAKALGYDGVAIRSWGFAAIDPAWQLLMGPAFAAPLALDRAGLSLEDVDLIDMHEAFAAQVLSNIQAFESKSFAEKHLNRSKALGRVREERLNLHGGSIALGHPFGATGARQALTVTNELKNRGTGKALITQCAAGGLGAALVLER